MQRGSSAEINYFQTVVKDLIKTIRRLPGNQICCDCSAPGVFIGLCHHVLFVTHVCCLQIQSGCL